MQSKLKSQHSKMTDEGHVCDSTCYRELAEDRDEFRPELRDFCPCLLLRLGFGAGGGLALGLGDRPRAFPLALALGLAFGLGVLERLELERAERKED